MSVYLIIFIYILLGSVVLFTLYFLDDSGYRGYYLHMFLPVILFFPLILIYIIYDKSRYKIKRILNKFKGGELL